LNISFSWNELPAYGARLLYAGIKRLGHPVTIIATKPQIPIRGMDKILGQKIYWINKENISSWSELELPVPNVFFQAGTYYISSFKKLGDEVRRNSGKVVLLSDNCWKNNIRQWGGALLFRLIFRRWFSAVWVPGKSGQKMMRNYGFPRHQIYQGLYGSDDHCFTAGPPLHKRPKQFIFVGQFIDRKGIPTLVKAFELFNLNYPDWKIVTYGAGEFQNLLENCPGVIVHSFAQPHQIADALKQSRFLVLPSKEDHWPLIVSEASLAGCGIILSNKVGNSLEFLNQKNGFVFPAKSAKKLSDILKKAALLSQSRLEEVRQESFRLGSNFTTREWSKKFCKIIIDLSS
tara:strand:- start:589 stop:1626 length:1038 start_codon:yes stop_codon:yes gene_type:complete